MLEEMCWRVLLLRVLVVVELLALPGACHYISIICSIHGVSNCVKRQRQSSMQMYSRHETCSAVTTVHS